MTAPSREEGFAYLLGDLREAEAEALETRLFEDDATHEQLRALEAELIDAYVVGELGPEQRGRFEARYLTSPERRGRVATARALERAADKSAPAPASAPPPAWAELRAWFSSGRWIFGPALAGAAVLLVVAVGTRSGPGPDAPGSGRLTLVPDVVRAADRPATLDLAVSPAELDVELALDGVRVGPEADVRLRRGGHLVERLRPSRVDEVAVQVRLQVGELEPGAYVVELWSGPGVEATLRASYAFRAR